MLKAAPNEDSTKLARVRDLLKEDMKVVSKPLPGGDYVWDAHGKVVAVEVKWSISDLLASLQTVGEAGGPRLAVEVRKMLAFADIPILLVPSIRQRMADGKVFLYESHGKQQVSNWAYNSVKGILADLALYGCIVDEWEGDVARRLAQWYLVSREQGHEWIRQRGRPEFVSLDPVYSEAVWMLCGAHGIGTTTAEKWLALYGSVRGVVNASAKELSKAKRITSEMAQHFTEVVTKEYK